MIYFAVALTILTVFEMLSSLWLYVKVAHSSTNYSELWAYTLAILIINSSKLGLLIWLWAMLK